MQQVTKNISSEFALSNPKTVQDQKDMYAKMGVDCEYIPVDLNGAYVPLTKPDLMNISDLPDVEDNIRDRFALSSTEDDDNDENNY